MSNAPRIPNDNTDEPTVDSLTDDERALFERLADRYEGEDVGRICNLVLQSSSDESSEEARS